MQGYFEYQSETFVAGNLKNCYKEWCKITNDPETLQTVMGLKIEFKTKAPNTFASCQNTFSQKENSFVEREIKRLIDKRVIIPSNHEDEEYISPIFVVPKDDNNLRLILNLKNFNKYLPYHHFKMDTLDTILKLVRPGCYMATVDLRDAYYTVPIADESQKYLKFVFNDVLYKYLALPNGLCSGPRKFTKLLKSPIAHLRHLNYILAAYLDDIFTTNLQFKKCLEGVITSVKLFDKLGFVVNIKKSQLIPKQKIRLLGFIIDSNKMIIYLDNTKKENIRKICEEIILCSVQSIRKVSSVIGTLVSSFPGVKFGKLYYRSLECDKITALKQNLGNFDKKMKISKASITELQWWADNIFTSYNTIIQPNADIVLETDASNTGWGAVLKSVSVHGHWTDTEKKLHINALELKSVFYALKTIGKDIKDSHVKILSDNTTAVFAINNMGTSHSSNCNKIAFEIWDLARKQNLWLSASHIPGKENKLADIESRKQEKSTEWKLDPVILKTSLDKLQFQPSIDLFASRTNCQFTKFISFRPDPDAWGIDAFSYNWKDFKFYAFPPFSLLPKVIQKIYFDKATGVLVVPNWPYQCWYTQFQQMLITDPVMISPRKQLLSLTSQPEEIHPMEKTLVLLIGLVTGK